MAGMKWSIRGVDPQLVATVQEVADLNGVSQGECLNEALRQWYAGLSTPDEDADTDLDIPLKELSDMLAAQHSLMEKICVHFGGLTPAPKST